MADDRTGLLSRWAKLPLRIHILLAGMAALAAAFTLRRQPIREHAPAVSGPDPKASPAFPTRLSPDALTETEATREAAPLSPGYRRDVVRPIPVQSAAEPLPSADEPAASAAGRAAAIPTSRKRDEHKILSELFRMPADPSSAPRPETPAGRPADAAAKEALHTIRGPFAPFGRLVKCTLVNSLDSATARAEPIVALVVRDLDWNGEVIIPAGTEAFGYARPEAILDTQDTGRLIDSGEWVLVFPASDGRADGCELVLKGRAVDRREKTLADDGSVRAWEIDDGTDGLIGRAISTLDDREIKLFAAAAVSGIAQGFGALAERQQPVAGLAGALGAMQPAATAGNAAIGSLGQGAVGVMNELADRMRQEIARRGIYVRVPAGKEFYLFVEQTIDPGAAAVGVRLPAR